MNFSWRKEKKMHKKFCSKVRFCETRKQISEKLKSVQILGERKAWKNIIFHSVAVIIWRTSRLSVSILHFIQDYWKLSIKWLTWQPPRGQDSQFLENKSAVEKKKLQNQKQGFYFWLKVSHYCKTFPIPQPGNDLQIIFLLALQKKRGGNRWKITGSPENLPSLCRDSEGKLTICWMLKQLRIRTRSHP